MLKGEAKKTYQREYMRGYMRLLRLRERLLRPIASNPVKTQYEPNSIFRKGTITYMGGESMGYPEIDADGNVIPDY